MGTNGLQCQVFLIAEPRRSTIWLMNRNPEHIHLFVTAIFPMIVREAEGQEEKVDQICGTCETVILEGETTPIAVHPIVRGEMPVVFEREPTEDASTPRAA